MYKIRFYHGNKEAGVSENETILEAALRNGVHINSSCHGKGVCGKCKIILKGGEVSVREEAGKLLTDDDRRNGYHIACLTYPKSDLTVEIPEESRLSEHQIVNEIKIQRTENKVHKFAGVAVDVGTTTVSAYLIDLKTGNVVDGHSLFNKQITYGEDVLTRIEYSKKENGMEDLNSAVIKTINKLIEKLFDDENFESKKADIKYLAKMVISGNTTMTYLLIKRNPAEIQRNVQIEDFRQSYSFKAKKLGITASQTTDLYITPGVGSYVGGDIVADIIATGIHKSDETCLIIDVGTNGELVLGNKDWLISASTSAGPAFEGTSTKFGMRATSGAIDKIKIERENGDFNVHYSVINNDKPGGICGSGLIHLIPELFLNKIIDYKGKFIKNSDKVRKSSRFKTGVDEIPEFVIAFANETSIKRDIIITEKDIENIIMTKAAIYAGVSTMTKVGVPLGDISRVYIAGGFGYHMDIEKSIILGLLPDIDVNKFEFIGNGSVKGSHMILISDEKRKEAEEVAKKATYFDLSTDALGEFTGEYINAMFIPHRNPDRFLSVEKMME